MILQTDSHSSLASGRALQAKLYLLNKENSELRSKLSSLQRELESTKANIEKSKDTIAFRLGTLLLRAFGSPANLLKLPKELLRLRKLAAQRKELAKRKSDLKSVTAVNNPIEPNSETSPNNQNMALISEIHSDQELRLLLNGFADLNGSSSNSNLRLTLFVVFSEEQIIPVPQPHCVNFFSKAELKHTSVSQALDAFERALVISSAELKNGINLVGIGDRCRDVSQWSDRPFLSLFQNNHNF